MTQKKNATHVSAIDDEIKTRIPLFRPEWMSMLNKLREHPHAPQWNTQCGDRLTPEDVAFISRFSKNLREARMQGKITVPDLIVNQIQSLRSDIRIFQDNIGNLDIQTEFDKIKPMTREDIVLRLADIVPSGISLDRLIVNDTSGTTGHPVRIPNHPRAIGCYDPMVLFMLERHGVIMKPDYETVACFLICSQENTITYSTVHSGLNGAGYAKINLKPSEWPGPGSAAEYINDLQPFFYAGDPLSFHELMKLNLIHKPKALLSTAMHLSSAMREIFSRHFSCPVIDMCSLNDTGPIAYSCPVHPDMYHILPTDIHAEIIDERGLTMNEGEFGEIAVTGGRNPFVPLLRYRTGDYGRIDFSSCGCGDPMPRLYDFQGRNPVYFRNSSGQTINPVDISKILRKYPIIQFQFRQNHELNCSLKIRAGAGAVKIFHNDIRQELKKLFGDIPDILIEEEPSLGSDGKIMSYISEFTI